jgi:hypothetical protein
LMILLKNLISRYTCDIYPQFPCGFSHEPLLQLLFCTLSINLSSSCLEWQTCVCYDQLHA